MTRPRIWKEPRFGGRPWCATHPDDPSKWRLCETWHEALYFVDNAINYPFPLDLENGNEEPMSVAYHDNRVFIIDRNDDDQIILHPRHWRPLASVLTRLADKEGVK